MAIKKKEYKGLYKTFYDILEYSLKNNLIDKNHGYGAAKDYLEEGGLKEQYPDAQILKFDKQSCWVFRKSKLPQVIKDLKKTRQYHKDQLAIYDRLITQLKK